MGKLSKVVNHQRKDLKKLIQSILKAHIGQLWLTSHKVGFVNLHLQKVF